MPVARRKRVAKCAWLANPTANATSASDLSNAPDGCGCETAVVVAQVPSRGSRMVTEKLDGQ